MYNQIYTTQNRIKLSHIKVTFLSFIHAHTLGKIHDYIINLLKTKLLCV